jgi:DNA-directed RNA polymerase subunit beta
LQQEVAAPLRVAAGLQAAFREIFPIDETERGRQTGLVLDFLEYSLQPAEFSPDECREKDLSYQAGLFAKLQLVHKDTGLIKEDQVFLGDLPLMTEDGSFVINGADRVIVSQIHRSPGVYFTGVPQGPNRRLTASIIPMPKRGPWIEIEFDNSDVLWMKVNKRKFPFTLLLRVLGYGDEAIRDLFSAHTALVDPTLESEEASGITGDEALLRLFTVLRPGDPPKVDKATNYLHSLLADPRRYDLGDAGRYKLNAKLGLEFEQKTLLGFEDGTFVDYGLIPTLQYLVQLQAGDEGFSDDDIDHLGNRRIRTVGELVADQIRVGLGRMARGVRERMLLGNPDAATPQKLVNNRPIVAALREFFGRSQLSQFKDQVNPLSELRHKRRISALGPGGLTRERAGFDVRDVHRTHYGRICPIETPEGANIGLITSLASFSRVNALGFIEAPYRRVQDGVVTDEVVYMTAHDEDRYIIAQANTPLTDEGHFATERIVARKLGDPVFASPDEVDFMDVSPKQIISIPTSLIPFLEHDDANRALMGSNMQSQAVPLIRSEAPFVGTGVEERVARDSGTAVLALESGTVRFVDATRVVVESDKLVERTYELTRFQRSNQNTNLDQRPVVVVGQGIEAGQVLADGPASDVGRLALGKNILIAVMPFDGYNFEDAIVLSERLVRDDAYTSVHIEKFEKEARDTKLGPEKITRDIPGLSEAALRDLDEDGVVRIGAEVKQGDILVGHTSFKGEKDPTPEERLLRSIFGEKAREVKDTSLRVPPGDGGIVLRTVRFRRGDPGVELKPGVQEMVRVYVAQKRRLIEGDKLANRHGNKGVVAKILPPEDMPYLEDGTPVDLVFNPLGVPSRMNLGQILETHLGLAALKHGVSYVTPVFDGARETEIKALLEEAARHEVEANRDAGFDVDTRERQVVRRAAKLGVIDEGDGADDALVQLARAGKAVLFDGRSGEAIDAPIVVGIMYVMKLYHMVEDKMHARSTGPYSLITQQPLGGKAQFGGQRLGEMECWALQAHGAAYTLQEMLTIKSDDIDGRNAAYEAIVKGDDVLEPTIPESFKVLVKELHSLGLDVRVLGDGDRPVDIFDETGRRW